jgi:hypothetical protein
MVNRPLGASFSLVCDMAVLRTQFFAVMPEYCPSEDLYHLSVYPIVEKEIIFNPLVKNALCFQTVHEAKWYIVNNHHILESDINNTDVTIPDSEIVCIGDKEDEENCITLKAYAFRRYDYNYTGHAIINRSNSREDVTVNITLGIGPDTRVASCKREVKSELTEYEQIEFTRRKTFNE